ncbi:MAG: hypothetical protein K8S56_00215 [Candidatus Cloacimonetes bacterium]|nr:hypothetical protein [Candidatus Cloacimonadota bacterium]
MTMINSKLARYYSTEAPSFIHNLFSAREKRLINSFLKVNDFNTQLNASKKLIYTTFDGCFGENSIFTDLIEEDITNLIQMEKGINYIHELYRGHFIHSVYVYLLGFYLLQDEILGNKFRKNLNIAYYDNQKMDKVVNVYNSYVTKNEIKEFKVRWALTTFFHDTDYTSELNYKIMGKNAQSITGVENLYLLSIKDLDNLLHIPEASVLRNELRRTTIPDYIFQSNALRILARRMTRRFGVFSEENIYNSFISEIKSSLENGIWDHGLLGAIYKLRKFYKELGQTIQNNSNLKSSKSKIMNIGSSTDITKQITRFTDASLAIALHNIKHYKTGIFRLKQAKIENTKLPLAFLLILCDELQTWDRQTYPNAGARGNDGRHYFNSSGTINISAIKKDLYSRFVRTYYEFYKLENVSSTNKTLEVLIPFKYNEKNERTYCHEPDKYDEKLKGYTITFKYINYESTIHLRNTNKRLVDKHDKKKKIIDGAWKLFSKNNPTWTNFLEICSLFRHYCFYFLDKKIGVSKKMKFFREHLSERLEHFWEGHEKIILIQPYSYYDMSDSKLDKHTYLKLNYSGEEVSSIEDLLKKTLKAPEINNLKIEGADINASNNLMLIKMKTYVEFFSEIIINDFNSPEEI